MIQFDQEICGDVEASSRREWLETNGIGGFASSTITGLNTRRYHGLLVAATKPPVGRVVMLSKLEETLSSMASASSFPQTAILALFTPRASAISSSFDSIPSPCSRMSSRASKSRKLFS